MSRQVDERVVSMQFDNKHFEKNVQTSMSTLDKLKEKLNLSGASKGLENVNAAAGKVDMSGLSGAVETVRSRFSALEIMGVTALANIANSAVNAGKRIVASLTIDPVKTGFSEYELKMNSIQTMMASTGESLETVNRYLEELNTYADKTIYSFSDMTQNIGKFTNAGVKLEDAVAAIKGISNEAAISGANSNEASRAMYNFAQALSSGYVKLIDWKSIELANMATVDFKEQLLQTAESLGTVKKTSDGAYKTLAGNAVSATKNFNETLQDQWMTSEVLITTLKKYSDETTEIGKKATEAATQVKTFSQLLDTLKESAQSGWAKTWEIVFGDFFKARDFFTMLSNTIGGALDAMSDARNNFLEGALGSPWDKFNEKINKAGVSTEDFQNKLKEVAKEHGVAVDDLIKEYDSLENAMAHGKISSSLIVETLKKLAGAEGEAAKSTENMTDKLEYFQKVVDKVWHGDYANGEARVKALEKAGYDYATVQDLVNKTVDGHKLTLEDLSDVQLKNIGYTEEQIETIRDLAEQAESSGTELSELIAQMEKPSGRTLIVESLQNALQGLGAVLGAVGKAWSEIFNPKDGQRSLYSFVEYLNKLSQHLKVNEEEAEKFVRVFKGIFALLDIVGTLIAGPIKIAFKLLEAILAEFDIDILTLAANIGDALVSFRDWTDNILDFTAVAKKIVPPIKDAIKAFSAWIETIKTSDDIPGDIIRGLLGGLESGIGAIADVARKLGEKILEVIKNVLGIHSPSTEMYEVGQNTVEGFTNGFTSMLSTLWNVVKDAFNGILEYCKGLDWGMVVAAGLSVGTLFIVNKILNILRTTTQTLASPLQGITEMISGFDSVIFSVRDVLRGIKKWFGSMALEHISKSLVNLAIAVAILTASIIALTFVPQDKLAGAVAVILTLVAGLTGVLFALSAISKNLGDFKESGAKSAFIASLGFTLLVIAGAIIALAFIPQENLIRGGIAVGAIMVALIAMMACSKLLSRNRYKMTNLTKVGGLFIAMATAILLIAGVIAAIGFVPVENLIRGGIVVGAIMSAFVGIMAATKLLSSCETKMRGLLKVGGTILMMTTALLLIAGAIAIIGFVPVENLIRGGVVIGAIMSAFVGIMAATKLLSSCKTKMGNLIKVGGMISMMSMSLLLVAGAIITLGLIPENILKRGGVIAGVIMGVFVGIMAATKALSMWGSVMSNLHKVGGMIFLLSSSLMIIAGAIWAFGELSIEQLKQGGKVIGNIVLVFAAIMLATRLLSSNATAMSSLVKVGVMMLAMSTAIVILAGAMYVLTKLNPERFDAALDAVMALILGFSALTIAASFAKSDKGGITMIGVCLGGIALIIAGLIGLSFVNPDRLKSTALALGGVMTTFAALVLAMSLLTKINKGSTWGDFAKITLTITAMVGCVAVLTYLMQVLDGLEDADRSLGTLGILVGVLAALALVGFAFSKLNSTITLKHMSKATLFIAMLVGLIALLVLVLGMLETFEVKHPGERLAVLLGALTALIGIAQLAASCANMTGKIALGVLALSAVTGVMALLALVLAMMETMNVRHALEKAVVLNGMLLVLIGLAALAGLLGPAAADIALGGAVLAEMVAVLALIVLVLAMMEAFNIKHPGEKLLILAAALLALTGIAAIAGALGAVAGAVALGGAVLAEMVAVLALIVLVLAMMEAFNIKHSGEKLLVLMGALLALTILAALAGALGAMAPFVALGGAVLAEMVAVLALIVLVLAMMEGMHVQNAETNANILSSFLLKLTGIAAIVGALGLISPLIATGALALVALLIPLTLIGLILAMMSAMNIQNAETNADILSSFLLKLTGIAAIVGALGIITGFITAGTLALTALMVPIALVGLILAMMSAMNIQNAEANATALVNVMMGMTLVAAALAVVGAVAPAALVGIGVLAALMLVLGALSYGLPGVGKNLGDFMTNADPFIVGAKKLTPEVLEGVKTLAECILILTAANIIDGISKWITGGSSLEKFGAQLPGLGTNLSQFAANLGAFSAGQVSTVTCAANAVKALAQAANALPADGGWWQKIFGGSGFDEFGKKLPEMAKYIKEFIQNLGTLGSGAVATVNAAANVLNAIANIGGNNLGSTVEQMSKFDGRAITFAQRIKQFCSDLSTIDTNALSATSNNISQILAIFRNIESANPGAGLEFANSLNTLGKTGVNSFILAFTDSAERVTTAGRNMAGNAVTGIREKYTDFSNAGSYLVDGFIAGIDGKITAAANKAAAMANAAEEAARNALDINSPSRVFAEIGGGIPEGFVLGIDKLSGTVTTSVTDMSDSAVASVKKSIAGLASIINSDVDVQPTIRPVMDLSGVRTGVNAIDGMLGADSTIGVMANVRSISSAMNSKTQNGGNDDIISAIKELGSMERNSYTIGGITYSEGTEVSDAIRTLVRAAKIERRT